MYVLGIDGGGTRTTGIVADEFGNVYMHAITGRSNPNTLQQAAFEEVLCGLIRELNRQNDTIFTQLSVCFAGIAGVGESGRDAEVAALLAQELPAKTKVIVRNDAFNALYSGTLGGPGIVQIAGTGAVTLGINENGEVARSGGWGYLFDDEGSVESGLPFF
jgi:N-acetylglucosamine kinase-like BadF-type ATPase